MHGVIVRKANVVHEDERRKLIEFMNGELTGKNIKILEVKDGGPQWQYLGGTCGHWHHYPECMVILEGEVKDYVMENLDTGEKETFTFESGDVVFRTGRIIHGGLFKAGTKVLDIGGETYISADFNDIPREDTK